MGPGMGAQFAQQVKELRSAYAGAVTSCAERIASAVFSSRSVLAVLQQHRLSPEPSVMSSQVSRQATTDTQMCLSMQSCSRSSEWWFICIFRGSAIYIGLLLRL